MYVQCKYLVRLCDASSCRLSAPRSSSVQFATGAALSLDHPKLTHLGGSVSKSSRCRTKLNGKLSRSDDRLDSLVNAASDIELNAAVDGANTTRSTAAASNTTDTRDRRRRRFDHHHGTVAVTAAAAAANQAIVYVVQTTVSHASFLHSCWLHSIAHVDDLLMLLLHLQQIV